MIETRWNANYIVAVLGWIFILVGLLGFIPNPLVYEDGLFRVNTAHNLVHLITGAVLVASPYFNAPVTTLRVVAVVYAVIAILGFIAPGIVTLNGAIAMNHWDHWLHLGLAALLLFIGFTRPLIEERITTAHM